MLAEKFPSGSATSATSTEMDRNDLTRTLFKGGVVLFLGLVIDLGISFVGKLLIARYLGRVDYGAVALGSSFLSFSSMILLLGLNNGVGRYIPRFDADAERVQRRATILIGLGITLPLSVIVAGAVVLTREWVATAIFRAPGTGDVLAIFAVGLPFAVQFKYALGIVRGYQWSVPKALLQNILRPLLRFGGIALGVTLGLNATGMSVAYIVPFVVAVIASLYWLRQTALFDRDRTARDVDYLAVTRELLAFHCQ